MAKTYLQIVNKVLVRLNEVPLDDNSFVNPRGLHLAAKNAVKDSIDQINSIMPNWPFNAAEHTRQLAVGVSEYSWPTEFVTADWRSFQLQKDDTLNLAPTTLRLADRDEWYAYGRDSDYNYPASSYGVPSMVFESHGNGFGVSPPPDQPYILKFRYYKNPAPLVNPSDEVNIPDLYEHVIVDGAMYHMSLHKENREAAMMYDQKFKEGINNMNRNLVIRNDVMRTTVIGRRYRLGFWPW